MSLNSPLYKENIIEHYKHPRNFKRLVNPDYESQVANVSCGDELTFSLKVNEGGIVEEVGFQGNGCAISIASASMLTEKLIGMGFDEAMKISSDMVLDMVGMSKDSPRVKCALLSLEAVRALKKAPTGT